VNYKTIVGDNIRGFRHRKDWTQEKLAVRTGLSNDYISRLELGKEGVSLDTIVTICKALKVDPYLLLIKDSYKKEA
jgi:transcriptional regulator with XRE-family HTH domain